MTSVYVIADRLDTLLRTTEIPDYPGAVNGLQFGNRRDITRIATAVDFSSRTVRAAVAASAHMLLIHHGMFWVGIQPITGVVYERYAALVANDIAVYSSHLPLDLHPEVGNNALLARRLGLVPTSSFARYKTIEVGLSGVADMSTAELVNKASDLAREGGGRVTVTPFPPGHRTRAWAACTGAGADSDTIREASVRGIDTLIVGEGPHHTAVQAQDLGIVVIYAGHYATETLGVRALGDLVANEFGIESTFLDLPTGL